MLNLGHIWGDRYKQSMYSMGIDAWYFGGSFRAQRLGSPYSDDVVGSIGILWLCSTFIFADIVSIVSNTVG